MSYQGRKQGFVLLMVLISIIIVGVALTTSARRSLQANLVSIESQEMLQRTWGIYSCQQTLLPAASALFDVSDNSVLRKRGRQDHFPNQFDDRLVLGSQTFDIVIADEDAKANINAIFDFGGLTKCEQSIGRLTGPTESRSIQLRPSRASDNALTAKKSGGQKSKLKSKESGTPIDVKRSTSLAFRSWGEVFDLVTVNRSAGDDRQIATMTKQISLMGTGKLNVLRATDDSILAVCSTVVQDGLARRIIAKIRDTALSEIGLILDQTVSNTEDHEELKRLLGTSSNSFSIWIEATNKGSRQQRFAVQSPNNMGGIETTEFSFE